MSSVDLETSLKELKQKRKTNQITQKEFYISLLNLIDTLMDELRKEDISEDNVKKQIPLILVFLEEQIEKLRERGH